MVMELAHAQAGFLLWCKVQDSAVIVYISIIVW